MPKGRLALLTLFVALSALALAAAAAARVPKHIIFPVVGKVTYLDDYGDPRPQGSHQGNDIMGRRWQVAVAAETGRVEKVGRGGYSCYLILDGRSGTEYWYIHLNNDKTRRNDNEGGCRNGITWPRGLRNGERVRAGEMVGYVGDSGDANGIQPHLHFEIRPNGRGSINPFTRLNRARRLLYAAPATTKSVSLRLRGTLHSTSPRLVMRVRLVRTSLGRYFRVAKTIGLDLAEDILVERKHADGNTRAASLAAAAPGETLLVWTKTAVPTLARQLGVAGEWIARRVLLGD
jgi:Peptidase family M23